MAPAFSGREKLLTVGAESVRSRTILFPIPLRYGDGGIKDAMSP